MTDNVDDVASVEQPTFVSPFRGQVRGVVHVRKTLFRSVDCKDLTVESLRIFNGSIDGGDTLALATDALVRLFRLRHNTGSSTVDWLAFEDATSALVTSYSTGCKRGHQHR